LFNDDLNKNEIPNLARALMDGNNTPKELIESLSKNYLGKLRSLKSDRQDYFDFALYSYLSFSDNQFREDLFRDTGYAL
jgi:hypothetical protein